MSEAGRGWRRRIGGLVDRRVDVVTKPRLDDLSVQIEDVRTTLVEVRRIVTDDLDASNEVAAHIGRSLAALTDEVAALRSEVEQLRSR